ncbi:MAG TPA: hypothetical protein VNG31_07955 [Candidatus Baltobacteraceae bacterium]|nr:hypothetical protein [Candidatus Baltobacteraceae bacterium]
MKAALSTIAISVFAAAAILLSTPHASAAVSSAGCRGFIGHWLGTWAGGTTNMVLARQKGSYDYRGGTLTGKWGNGVFSGSYAQNDGSTGTFRFVLSNDGNSFHGWYATSAYPGKHLYWNGICQGSL